MGTGFRSFSGHGGRHDGSGRRESVPVIGATHPVVHSLGVRGLFTEIAAVWSEILPDTQVGDPLSPSYRTHYNLFDDQHKMAVTVVESRQLRKHTEEQRIKWNPNDVGRVAGRIADVLGRLDAPTQPFTVPLTEVFLVGGDRDHCRKKLAARLDPDCQAVKAVDEAHFAITEVLEREVPGFEYQEDGFDSHFTLGKFKGDVTPAKIDECIEATQPLFASGKVVVPLLPLQVISGLAQS